LFHANRSDALCGEAAMRQTVITEETLEGPMVREIELLAVSLVFVFLGACVFGLVH
jgi:hypothetical protein